MPATSSSSSSANVDDNDDEMHALAPFLEERLPALGLDYETYGAYVLPLLTDEEADADEWDSVLELLQASSETHSDNDTVWKELRRDIEAAWQSHRQELQQQEQKRHEQREQEMKEQLEREVQEITQQLDQNAAAAPSKVTNIAVDDAAKRALLNRFAYEDPEGEGSDEDNEAPPHITNQQAAQQLEQVKHQELRAHKTTTKREEQQKTAQAKKNKLQLKEERRQRASKGERKR